MASLMPSSAGGAGVAAPVAPIKDGTGIDAYEVVATIGKGSFGTVSKVRRKADNRLLVWKELNYGSMRDKEKQLVVSEVSWWHSSSVLSLATRALRWCQSSVTSSGKHWGSNIQPRNK